MYIKYKKSLDYLGIICYNLDKGISKTRLIKEKAVFRDAHKAMLQK